MNSPQSADSSPLLAWAKEQPIWIRQVVHDVLDGTTTPENKQIDRYVDLFLREVGLATPPIDATPSLSEPPATVREDNPERLVIESLTIQTGVNAIREGAAIPFAPSLTVVYGDNGSGKSGFVRVIKRAASARTHTDVLGNVRKRQSGTPSALFAVKVGDKVDTLKWQDEVGLAPMTQVSVFDTPSSRVHVDEDLTYTYTPDSLGYYRTIRDVIEDVRSRINDQIATRAVDVNHFQPLFTPGTSVYQATVPLSSKTDLQQLQSLAAISAEDIRRKAELDAELTSLRSASPAAQIKIVEGQRSTLQRIQTTVAAAVRFDWRTYNARLEEVRLARQADQEATVIAFESEQIPGKFGKEWRALIDAAYAYEQASREHGHDATTTCAYCRQPLGEAAAALLEKYRALHTSTARHRLTAAQAGLTSVTTAFLLSNPADSLERLRVETDDHAAHPWSAFRPAIERVASLHGNVQASRQVSDPDLGPLQTALASEDERLTGLLTTLRTQGDELTAKIGALQSQSDTIKDRTALAGALPALERMSGNLQWSDTAAEPVRRVTTSLRQLTEAASEHSSKLVNANFGTCFQDECTALDVREGVVLEFPGREAQSQRKKVIAGASRPSDVLSEGEQKAVALADFLAEATISGINGPVVFDDPVNSMDYRRLALVANRLQALAKKRQVIVFTHNVWFVSALLDLDKDRELKKTATYWEVARDGDDAGVVSPGSHPKVTSYKVLGRRLKDAIDKARRVTGESQLELVMKGYGILRSITEVVAEQGLLRGVTQRYQAHVVMTQLPSIDTANLHSAIERVCPVYEKACRFMDGHSQPLEQSNVQPTLAELEADFAVIEIVVKEFPLLNP